LVFPVMRGSAPLLTALAALLVLGEHLSALALAGLAIASLATAAFALPERNFGGSRALRNSALAWAIGTGAMVAVYNVVDATGTRGAPNPFTFSVWLFLLDWIGVNTVTFLTRRRTYLAMLRSTLRFGAAAGALSLLSFGAALYGFSIARVAYISAMRETAVIFAAVLGWLFLKEGFGARRTMAAVILTAGLSLLQFG
jgi:drug/metabolite transporter (DMT)-like permease